MDGWIVVFALPRGMTPAQRVRFHDRLWGRRVTTHGGKYVSHREGLMQRVPHRRLTRGVFLVRRQDVVEVRRFLEQWGAAFHVRRVALEAEDLGAMRPSR